MLFINDERIDLKRVGEYTGRDPVMILLFNAYEKVKRLGYPIVFKSDKLQKGYRDGKKGISFLYSGEVNTQHGTTTIVYATSAHADKFGVGVDYRPRRGKFENEWHLHAGDLDKILFMMVGCSLVKAGTIYVEDRKAIASELARKRSQGSTLMFYLYNEQSPVYHDIDKLCQIALAIGISNPSELSDDLLRNAIFERVEAAEQVKDGTFGYQWFDDSIKEFTPVITALTFVQKALDERRIRFDDKMFRWNLVDDKGDTLRMLCQVEPQKHSLRREILATLCTKNSEIYSLIKLDKPKEQETPKSKLPDELPSAGVQPTTPEDDTPPKQDGEVDFDAMSWPQLKSLATKIGISVYGKKKSDLLKELKIRQAGLQAGWPK
jgi:hypothetical protein